MDTLFRRLSLSHSQMTGPEKREKIGKKEEREINKAYIELDMLKILDAQIWQTREANPALFPLLLSHFSLYPFFPSLFFS